MQLPDLYFPYAIIFRTRPVGAKLEKLSPMNTASAAM